MYLLTSGQDFTPEKLFFLMLSWLSGSVTVTT